MFFVGEILLFFCPSVYKNSRFSNGYTDATIPRTSPLASARRLVRGYSFSLLAELRPVLRTPLYVPYVLLS